MSEAISFLEFIVICVCFLGVTIMLYRLFKQNRCEHGGTCDWYVKREYQMLDIHECKKCRETKSIEKL